MDPIVYINSTLLNYYKNDSLIGRIKDRFKISLIGESFIKELDLIIATIKFPPNFNKRAYIHNIHVARKMVKSTNAAIAPKTYRYLDYKIYNEFQKKLMAFSIVKSSQLVLRASMKSIRDSCIVIYDAADEISLAVIEFMARECKYIVLVSENIPKIKSLSEYIVANYGVTPIITREREYAIKSADIIVTSRSESFNSKAFIWYLDNMYIPMNSKGIYVNDVTYNTPWSEKELEISPELLGAILCQMQEKDIETSLKYNDVWMDKIKFNDSILTVK